MADEEEGMGRRDQTSEARPWPVYVLIALGGAGLVWGLIADNQRTFWDIPRLLFGLWVTYSLFTGKTWAFTLSFMLATLCAGGILLIAGVQLFLLEGELPAELPWGFLSFAVWIALLMHPATKRFAGLAGTPGAKEEVAAG